jgi:hypothetical protein
MQARSGAHAFGDGIAPHQFGNAEGAQHEALCHRTGLQ